MCGVVVACLFPARTLLMVSAAHLCAPQPEPVEAVKVPQTIDDVEIVGDEDSGDVFAAYYADSSKETDRAPVFNEELGLAVEGLREGLTLNKLWSAV